jgi:hypothetical protein
LDFRWLPAGLFAASLMIGCAPAPNEGGREVTNQPLADELTGWTADGPVENFDAESIFAYIDGHAEVFLAYGMQRCVSRRYAGPNGKGELVVDLFEMPSTADAFGVYSHDRVGEEVDVGQGAIYRLGWLSFWKGHWYGSIYAADAVPSEALIELAAAVADGLALTGEPPELPGRLPPTGLDSQSVCFLRSPQILNAHIWVGSDNPFGLGSDSEAVVGKYNLEDGSAHVVIVRYPDGEVAAQAEERLKAVESDGAEGPVMTIGRSGEFVAAVVGEAGGDEAATLLELALGGE